MKGKIAMFIGHSTCSGINVSALESVIEDLILEGTDSFLCGGMGSFDRLCAGVLHRLKKKYPHILCCLVLPYLAMRFDPDRYDEVLYPEGLEHYHFKAAIGKRNQYMVMHADTAICYVNHTDGGAAKTYAFAKKQGLKIINLGIL